VTSTGEDQIPAPLAHMLGEMAAALAEEARHAQQGAQWIRIRNGRRLRAGLDRILYCFDADADFWFPPGTTAEVSAGDAEPVVVEVLEVRGQSLWLESPEDLGEAVGSARIRSNPWYLLDALRSRIDELRGEGEYEARTAGELHLVASLLGLEDPAPRVEVSAEDLAAGYEDLPANQSQLQAVAACLGNELRFVWGPPGTGKTEALGLLAAESYLRGESVLVVAHSNAAVDAAAIALARNLVRAAEGRGHHGGVALRVGEPFLPEVQTLPLTERYVLQQLRPDLVARLETLEGRGGELMDRQDSLFGGVPARQRVAGRELARVTDELRRVREQLGRARREMLRDAQVVLATFSKAAVTPEIYERRFDRVLVDEASMAQPPQVALAASLATGSVGVFGDFRQLAPVVQSWSRPVKQWLGRDVFELNGLVRHPETSQLLSVLDIQYRMHPTIMQVVNGPSYGGRLKADAGVEPATAGISGCPPAAGEALVWIDTGELATPAFATRTHSRLNPVSAWLAIQIALGMVEDGLDSIGVVTPYRDQARLLRLLVRAAGATGAVHTGTIHRFQGGERDAIVLDLVDAAPLAPGTLFRSDDGLRLLNVAITRARGKLVCLADGSYLRRGSSSASPAWAILANLCGQACPVDPSDLIDARGAETGWAILKSSVETAAFFEQDLSDSAEGSAFQAGLPGWALTAVQDHPDVRLLDSGARGVLLPSQAWFFPKRTAWCLRLSDPQAMKLLHESIGGPGPSVPAAAQPETAAASPPAPARPAVPAGAPPLGVCRRCNEPLGLSLDASSGGVRIACSRCGSFEREAEPSDLTSCARAQGVRCGCGAELRGRRGSRGLFLGCSTYPRCRNTRQAGALTRA
jgi:hypothetical protein